MAEKILSRIRNVFNPQDRASQEERQKNVTFPRCDDPEVIRTEGYCIDSKTIYAVFIEDPALDHLSPEQKRELWERIEARLPALGWTVTGRGGAPNPLYIRSQEVFRQLREIMDGRSNPFKDDLKERVRAVHAWLQLSSAADSSYLVSDFRPYQPGFKAGGCLADIGHSLENQWGQKHQAVRRLLWLANNAPEQAHALMEMILEATQDVLPAVAGMRSNTDEVRHA